MTATLDTMQSMATDTPSIPRGRCQCGCGRMTRHAPYTSKARGWVKGRPLRYLHGHGSRDPNRPEYRVVDRGYETPCWVWQKTIMRPRGYGTTHHNGKSVMAHRWYYEQHKGPIPEGLHIDHLCRVNACVNPDHLEAVTCKENLRRGKGTKLSMQEVREIVMRHLAGESAIDLAREYECEPNNVQRMSRGAEAVLLWD